MTEGKVTGANVSVKLTDAFMQAAIDGKPFVQQYPIDADEPLFKKEISATDLWKKSYTTHGSPPSPAYSSGTPY